MPTMAFIEDDKHRFSILSANSLGFSNLKPGTIFIQILLFFSLNYLGFSTLKLN
jgi:hypothetical protein